MSVCLPVCLSVYVKKNNYEMDFDETLYKSFVSYDNAHEAKCLITGYLLAKWDKPTKGFTCTNVHVVFISW